MNDRLPTVLLSTRTKGDERAFGLDFDPGSKILKDASERRNLFGRFGTKAKGEFLRKRGRRL